MTQTSISKVYKHIFSILFLLTHFTLYAQKISSTREINSAALNSIMEANRPYYRDGKVADYIPELGKMDPRALAFAVVNEDGKIISVGDVHHKFTMQSISKTIALMLAVMERGEQDVFDNTLHGEFMMYITYTNNFSIFVDFSFCCSQRRWKNY